MGRGEILLGLIIGVFTTIFIINDAKKRGMSQAWGAIGFFLGLIGLKCKGKFERRQGNSVGEP
jgi:hypothetical protein